MTTFARHQLVALAAAGILAVFGLAAGAVMYARHAEPLSPVERGAHAYIRLVGLLGARDPDTLDGEGSAGGVATPATRVSFDEIARQARDAAAALRSDPSADHVMRREHLITQLQAIQARAEQLDGHAFSFAEEFRRQFGRSVRLPPPPKAPARLAEAPIGREGGQADLASPAKAGHHVQEKIALEALLPGSGRLSAKLEAYESRFAVPVDRLPAVFERSLAECRRRTVAKVSLPAGESVSIAYVRGRGWSGYSRYLGSVRSRIEVNTSLPLTVDRVLELACHEGYPGHHVYSLLRDRALVEGRGWSEFSVTPLFSPDAFVAEATASLAAMMVFSNEERLAFERDVLFPQAGLNASETESYLTIIRLRDQLNDPLARVVEAYLSGDMDIVEAGWALESETLMAHPLATLQFVNEYRGYALAYTLGKARLMPIIGPDVPADERWRNFMRIIKGENVRR
jgi:hypothetical protein